VSGAASRPSVKFGALLAALAGLIGAAYLVFRIGFQPIFDAAISVGWGGFVLLCLYHLANFTLVGFAWRMLVSPLAAKDALTFCWGRAVRDSAGDVLPFSQVGGMLIGVRAVMLRGIARAKAFGSMIVDVTVEMIAQLAFIMAGLAILMARLPELRSGSLVKAAAVAIAMGAVLAAAFVVVQRRGFGLFERIAQRLLPAAALHAGELNRTINEIHSAPRRLLAGFSLHLLGWLSAAFGTWLALALTGHRIPFVDAVAIESLLCALRSATAFVPAAIGVQEAGYAVMMPLFGLPAELGIAVSLLKRAREIAVGVPLLLSWQLAEGRRAFHPGNSVASESP
jgi:glycosyltransferase 2 family protein